MRRSRPQKEALNVSSMKKNPQNGRRSSSFECAVRRGSYQPTSRRPSSAERLKVPGSAMKTPGSGIKVPGSAMKNLRSSPRGSFSSIFPTQRGSLADRKLILKDNRPLSDKSYQKQCIQVLVNYLEENNFPFVVSRSALLMPQMKDFEHIFQFLFQKFDPSYQVKKIEDEGPKLMKMIGYPFTVSKSSFRTITRMSWPQLLGVLMWMLDLCKITDSVSFTSPASDSEFDDAESQSILLNYVLQSYKAGVEDPEKENAIFGSLVSRISDGDFNAEDAKEKLAQLHLEINKKLKEKMEYDRLIGYNKGAVKDIENLKDYISKMTNHRVHKLEALEEMKAEEADKEKQLENLQSLASEKEKIYKAQGFDGQQAQNYYSLRKTKLLEQLNEKISEVKEKESKSWDLKIEISEISDKLDSFCLKFNLIWDELRSVIETVLSPLSTVSIPAAVKLYKERKLVLADIQITMNNYAEVKQVLDKVKSHILDLQQNVHKITSMQNTYKSEFEMNISDLTVKQEVSSALSEQKKRELDIVISDGEREVKAIRLQGDALQKKLNDIHDELSKKDKEVFDLKKSIKELLVKCQEVNSSQTKEGEVAKESHQRALELLQNAHADINVEKQKLHELLETLSQMISGNPM